MSTAAALRTPDQKTIAELEAQLAEKSERLEKFENAERRAEEQCSLAPVIRLDVGGVVFATSAQTLTSVPGSMLAAMFSGRFAIRPDATTGCYFIDRDGTHFRHILNYLRDRCIPVLRDEAVRIELFREAQYYSLVELAEALVAGESDVAEQLNRVVLSSSAVVDFSLAEPEAASVTGYFSGDGRLSWARGYEVTSSVPCRICSVHTYLTLPAGKSGIVTIYDSNGHPLASGSRFNGPQRGWTASDFSPPLALDARRSYLIFTVLEDGSYHCVSHGGNPQTGRGVENFTIYGRSCPSGAIQAATLKTDSNKFNLLMRVVKLEGLRA